MINIVNARPEHYGSHTDVLNAVASEKKYLSSYGGFTKEGVAAFHEICESRNFPHLLAVDDNNRVVGWCDIVSRDTHPREIGFIGVGLLPEFREQGIGKKLMIAAMDAAKQNGFTEIRLECRADNKRAIHVYRQLGFKKYRRARKALVIGSDKFDLVFMRKSKI